MPRLHILTCEDRSMRPVYFKVLVYKTFLEHFHGSWHPGKYLIPNNFQPAEMVPMKVVSFTSRTCVHKHDPKQISTRQQ